MAVTPMASTIKKTEGVRKVVGGIIVAKKGAGGIII